MPNFVLLRALDCRLAFFEYSPRFADRPSGRRDRGVDRGKLPLRPLVALDNRGELLAFRRTNLNDLRRGPHHIASRTRAALGKRRAKPSLTSGRPAARLRAGG